MLTFWMDNKRRTTSQRLADLSQDIDTTKVDQQLQQLSKTGAIAASADLRREHRLMVFIVERHPRNQ